MKKNIIYLFLVFLLVSCGSGSGKSADVSTNVPANISANASAASAAHISLQSVLSNVDKGEYKSGELLVKFKPGVMSTSALQTHAAIGATVIKNIPFIGVQEVSLPEGTDIKTAITQYMQNSNVEYAEPNYIYKVNSTMPNDLYFTPQQWALYNTGTFASGTAGADIKAPEAWDISRGSGNIIVAIVDTGIDYTHVDLVGNLWTNPDENPNDGIDNDNDGKIDDWRGWNFISDNNDPWDDFGHGTHVAGIIGAVGNNGIGVTGLMWNVKLMALKACDSEGMCPTDAVTGAIGYAVAKGAKVINMSLGGFPYSNSFQDALSSANNAGVIVVTSAGNGGADGIGDDNDLLPNYPSGFNLPNIISVAATDQNDNRAAFSNFGLNTVHVAAPGTYILSTVPPLISAMFGSMCTGSGFAGYDFCEGTSMAAPYVTSLAGLLYSAYNQQLGYNYNYSQIRGLILKNVDVLPTLNGFIYTGGRINAFKAVSAMQPPANLSATAASSASITLSWTDSAGEQDKYIVEKESGSGFVEIGETSPNASSYTDSGLNPSATYTYRIKAYSSLPNPPGVTPVTAESAYSAEASATTPANDEPPSPGSGGGGCSIGARQSASNAAGDIAVMLMPLVFIAVMRRKRS